MKAEKATKLLRELIRDSRRSDRELAKAIGVSQPTVTRNRRLLKDYIRSYTIVPEFSRIGYEILAITFAKDRPCGKDLVEKKLELAKKWVMQHPNVLFASSGEGLAKDAVMVSVHRDYSKYADFMRDYTLKFSEFMTDVQSFIVSLKAGTLIKPFDLRYLAEDADLT